MADKLSVKRVAKQAKAEDAKARAVADAAAVDSFVNFAMKLGISADNASSGSTYGFNPVTRQRTMLEWIHRGSWVGGVAVDVIADDMTREGIEIEGSMPPDQMSELHKRAAELGIWSQLRDTVAWSRLYGGAIAVLLIDGQDHSKPLRLDSIRKDQFCGLLVLDRWMVEPSLQDLVTELGPNLGLPKFYQVTANAPALPMMKIHYSRCIRLEGIRLPYWQRLMENMWGISIYERIYDRMVAFDSATTGAAQLVYKAYIRTYKIDQMREIIAMGGDALNGLTKYVEMMRAFQGIEGVTLMDAKDEFEGVQHNAFSGLSDALVQFGQQLSGALQIPLIRLFGQSPAGFNTGDADLRNYYDGINTLQARELGQGVLKVYKALAYSCGYQVPDDFGIEFNSLWKMTDEQKSNIANTTTQAVTSAESGGVINRAVALKELKQSSRITGVFTNITDEMIQEAEEDEAATPPSAEGLVTPPNAEGINKPGGNEL